MDDKEMSLLIDRKYTCPVCDSQITAKSVKSNSARFVDTKADLRPIHSNINVTKYETVCCPHCGFSALTKNFTNTTSTQRKLIKEKITANFKPREDIHTDVYTTQTAITRMKMTLLCTVTKGGKSSEIGQVCLKLSWLYQDMVDELDEADPDYATKKEEYLKEADHAAMNAYEHLSNARMHEDFPIAGMNETTLDYLLAYLAYKKGEYPTSMKLLSNVISNRSTSPRLKDKSAELKAVITPLLHEEG
jgi:uncharacterized protein (DUF2225 family)